MFDQSPFYAESGGQAGDQGEMFFAGGGRFARRRRAEAAPAMCSRMSAKWSRSAAKAGDVAELKIDRVRRAKIRANHSATHLLHAALRNRLGKHVTQKGSLVEADYFRFDFSHTAPMTREDIEAGRSRSERRDPPERAGGNPRHGAGQGDRGGRDGAVRREVRR